MKKTLALVLGILFACGLFNACCKDPGYDGEATLVVRVKHHEKTIASDSAHPLVIYIKAGAEESPGTSAGNYDKTYYGTGTENHVNIEGVKCGKYFIYAMGNDPASGLGYNVKGGQGISIKHKNRKKEIDIDIAVTE